MCHHVQAFANHFGVPSAGSTFPVHPAWYGPLSCIVPPLEDDLSQISSRGHRREQTAPQKVGLCFGETKKSFQGYPDFCNYHLPRYSRCIGVYELGCSSQDASGTQG